jgi:dihydroorotase
VAIRDGRIAATGSSVPGSAEKQLDFPDAVLLPGLVDLHAHPARGASKYGIDPDRYMLPFGVTTVLSQGDAGAITWPAYRDDVMRVCQTRVRLALNLAAHGEAMPFGCFTDPDEVDVPACVAAVRDGGDDIWGLAVNVSRFACGPTDPRWVMEQALEAATQTGKPLLYGPRETTDWPLSEQLIRLRPGDVVTYCFMSTRNVLDGKGHIDPAARAARARGVLFDVGHGVRAFDRAIAATALADGFPPDTISSDVYAAHVGRLPRHDLPRMLALMIAAGMPERDAFAAVTTRPAAILGLAGAVGTLAPGACADLTVLRCHQGDWEAVLTVRAGVLVRPR